LAFCAASIRAIRAFDRGLLGVSVGGCGGVGGGELGREQRGASGAEHAVSEEAADDLVEEVVAGHSG
jgi:hypothetical protein